MNKIELLSPVGNMECLHAAVQNGADSVYFGSNLFSARAFASNFDDENLKEAISYAKLRGVKTHLTLNTLIKNDEFAEAVMLAKKAYEYGIDAIIVQDLGLSLYLIKNFPDLSIHASTQLTAHNLDGVLELEDLGFKRVVLSRELSLQEIKYICENSNVEIETFIHGALCISYSGQCLYSSMVGGRSGNRGKCAQPCRLPYKLVDENETLFDKGYLLSTRDLCGLDFIPDLIDAGVTCFKIEGRMKSPEYVSIVTRIYRKYIDLAYSNEPYIIDENDRKMLALAFNRGGFSSGHLKENKNLIFKEKPNNMGLFLGTIKKYDSKKGLITLKLNESLSIGDSIAVQKETNLYNVSELMKNNSNEKICNIGDIVTIGRMKGNINIGDKVYKMSDKALNFKLRESFNENSEFRKIALNAKISLKLWCPVTLTITDNSNIDAYKNLNISVSSEILPEKAQKSSLTVDKVIEQISKIKNTPYEFSNIDVDLEDNLFLPNSVLNELKRNAIEKVKEFALNNINRSSSNLEIALESTQNNNTSKKISVLLNILDLNKNYYYLEGIDNIYVPLKYFVDKTYSSILHTLENKFNLYIYLPTIMRNNYNKIFENNIENIIGTFDVRGFVISNISGLHLINNIKSTFNKNFDFVGNYTLNIYNCNTANNLFELGINTVTISPELDLDGITQLCNSVNDSELIVYGNIPLMNTNYCLFGKTNKCHTNCIHSGSPRSSTPTCKSNFRFYLKDRMNYNFRVIPDNIDTVSTIYNSKITSIESSKFNISSLRIEILDESIDEINEIINTVKQGRKLEGKNYTNGNLNREI